MSDPVTYFILDTGTATMPRQVYHCSKMKFKDKTIANIGKVKATSKMIAIATAIAVEVYLITGINEPND